MGNLLLNDCEDSANIEKHVYFCLSFSHVVGGKSTMASAKKVTEKRHNPVESICRKIRAIQKREISHPIQHIVRYQSSSFDSPQTNPKKDLEEVLRRMIAAQVPPPNTLSSSSERGEAFISPPHIASPGDPTSSHPSSPESAAHSAILTRSENISRPRSQSPQNCTSLRSQIRKRERFSNKDLNNYCNENDFRSLTLDFDSASDQSSGFFTPQDSVVKKLSLNEEGKYSSFNICSVEVTKIIDYLRQTAGQGSEEGVLEELWNMLDPEKRDPQMNLETFQAIVKEWMAHGRNKREGVTRGSCSGIDDSAFEQDSIKSGRGIKMTTDSTDFASRSFEALGGDVSNQVLEVSDLITYVTDLHFNKQKLEEENNKFKLALETLEEANSQLSQDCTELHLQIKSAHQAIMRTNLLKEELEELKICMSASEEQKTMVIAQNKQLETENRALILKIRILQEENAKNIMDIYKLEEKIEELSKTENEHQMQLHTYENTLLHKDASLQKKDLSIEELKSTIIEHGRIIEGLRGDKNRLAHELQRLQQELIINGIQLTVNGERKNINSEGEKSLHCELILAQSAEHEDVSEVEALIGSSLPWVTDPEITLREKWENKLTEFKSIMEEKLNLCLLMPSSLRNHKESLDKEFVKLIEILKQFRLEYFYFRKEFLSRQKQLEAITQLQEDAVSQEAIFRKKVQEASQWLEDAEKQVGWPLTTLYAGEGFSDVLNTVK
ncbi:Lymphoid-restricted membrane protein [Camelus dromedarius]|uniref:Lymphoid-restricted membrane protein n=1 Tax=Camelus dromedarius TaxID=9838 RepID=A0A5N4C5I9_CAMDR|nr:Lymphoid-restricted membrane protein [Camelus dromedarius]